MITLRKFKTAAFYAVLFIAGCANSDLTESRASAGLKAEVIPLSDALCPECGIELDSLAVLGTGASETGGPADFSHVSLGADGRFYMAPTAEPGRVEVYDTMGVLALTFGRRGSGPGELRVAAAATRLPDGRILVLDSNSRLPLVYYDSLGEFRSSEEHRLGMVRGVHPTPIGTLVEAFYTESAGLVTGSLIRADSVFVVRLQPRSGGRTRAAAEGRIAVVANEIWFVRGDGREYARFSADGRLLEDSEWSGDQFDNEAGYVGGITSLDGYLVVISLLENPDFTLPKGWPVTKRLTPELANEKIDTRMDVIDPASLGIVTAVRFDQPVVGVAGPGVVWTEVTSPDGGMKLRLSRLRLTGQRGGRRD